MGDDLRRDCAGDPDRFGTFDAGVAEPEAMLEHAFQIHQTAVGERQEG